MDAVNAALAQISSTTAYDATKKSAGPLMGDPTVRSVQQQLLNLVSGAGAAGVSLTRDGTVTFDQTAFLPAFAADPAKVKAAFGATSTFTPAAGVSGASATPPRRPRPRAARTRCTSTASPPASSGRWAAAFADGQVVGLQRGHDRRRLHRQAGRRHRRDRRRADHRERRDGRPRGERVGRRPGQPRPHRRRRRQRRGLHGRRRRVRGQPDQRRGGRGRHDRRRRRDRRRRPAVPAQRHERGASASPSTPPASATPTSRAAATSAASATHPASPRASPRSISSLTKSGTGALTTAQQTDRTR